MNARHCLRLGLVLFAVGGCSSSQPKPVSTASINKNFNAQTPQPAEEPKWETPGQPAPDLLAQKTAAYANSMQSPDTTDNQPSQNPSAALFNEPGGAHRHRHADPIVAPVAAAPPPAVPSPRAGATAGVSPNRAAPGNKK